MRYEIDIVKSGGSSGGFTARIWCNYDQTRELAIAWDYDSAAVAAMEVVALAVGNKDIEKENA